MNWKPTALALAGLAFASGQEKEGAAAARFEVATIKPVMEARGVILGYSASGPRVRYTAFSVPGMIREAYGLKPYELAVAPGVNYPREDFYQASYYDIDAKAEGDSALTRAEFRPMLRTLLAERFHLRFHREVRDLPIYAMVLAKDGPKFKRAAPDADATIRSGPDNELSTFNAPKLTTGEFATQMGDRFFVDRPVIDRTGLAGFYAFQVTATQEFRMKAPDPEMKHISIFTALQQQLGLKLEPATAKVKVLVVDSVEKPGAN